jgi:hypothetical protein
MRFSLVEEAAAWMNSGSCPQMGGEVVTQGPCLPYSVAQSLHLPRQEFDTHEEAGKAKAGENPAGQKHFR